MSRITGAHLQFTLHTATGILAIIIMLFHATWATAVLIRGDQSARNNFRKLSVHVWAVWLIPYLSGIIIGVK